MRRVLACYSYAHSDALVRTAEMFLSFYVLCSTYTLQPQTSLSLLSLLFRSFAVELRDCAYIVSRPRGATRGEQTAVIRRRGGTMSEFIERFEIRQKNSSGETQEINGNIAPGVKYVAVITRPQTSMSSIFIGAIKLYEQTPGPNNFVFDFVSKWSLRASLLPISQLLLTSSLIFLREQTTS